MIPQVETVPNHDLAVHQSLMGYDPMSDNAAGVNQLSKPASKLACALSGLVVGLAVGAIVGCIALSNDKTEGMYISLAVGAIFGLLFGRRIAANDSIIAGATVGGLLPLGLIVIDGIRRGRFNAQALRDFQEPKGWLILAAIFGGGALIGGSLVGIRKAIDNVRG